MTGWIVLIVVLALVGVVAAWAVGLYNRLVTLQNRYENAYAQIDVQLKRRYDLIPNLVETAQGYLDHERETLEAVTEARQQAVQANAEAARNPGDPTAMQKLNGAEGALTQSLGRLLAVREDYPDLKANEQMSQLMEELRSTENKVAFARQAFNDAATRYNTQRETFPSVAVANSFDFRPAELFEIRVAREREAPDVSFS